MYTRVSEIQLKFLLLLVLAFSAGVEAFESKQAKAIKLTQDLGIPWGMSWLDEQTILITDRQGQLRRFNIRTGKKQSINGVPNVWSNGQGGLLDVAVKTPYSDNDWVFFTYSKPVNEGAATSLARGKINGNRLEQWQDLLVTQSASRKQVHFGGRIAIRDDHIFFSVGERGHRPNAQDLTNHAGKILRVNLDGSVPEDNPFINRKDALPEIWSYGHRNPQGLCFDSAGRLWESEHGPRGGDEINLIKPAENYGWPVVSFGKEYYAPIAVGEATEKPGMTSPLHVYAPSIAPGSLLCSRSQASLWHDTLLLGALALQHLNQVAIIDGKKLGAETRWLENENYRIRSLLEGPSGEIYFATDNGDLFKIDPVEQ